MIRSEIDARIQALNEQQLQLTSIMSQSDAHASKCIKLGLNFAESYPEDYVVYTKAREQYNDNEEEIKELMEIEPEEEMENNHSVEANEMVR